MLVSAKEMLEKAREGKYAVGQFNINNLEWTKAILLTAQENNSPVMRMAKKIVEVDEDLLKGMMTSDIPLYGRDTERKETEPAPKKAATAEPENISDAPAEREISEQPKSVRNRRKKESGSDYRELFLVNTPSPNRSQTYINRDIYERIKRFLPLIAPEVSIASYISNILGDHIERHWEEINEMYSRELSKPL